MELVYADDALLVLNKPAGLLSVPGKGPDKQDCLSSRVQCQWPSALVVHRLDQATSGLVIMALTLAAQRAMGQLFEARKIHKSYVAYVCGTPPTLTIDQWAQVDLPIAADWERRPLRVIDPVHGKSATTRWRRAAPGEGGVHLPSGTASDGRCRVILEPLTGRTHQLRLHMQASGHPIVGDRLYGSSDDETGTRLLLHAYRLQFPHPVTGAEVLLTSAAPF